MDSECNRDEIDPRGPRFGGAVTSVVLALALIFLGTPFGTFLIVWQLIVFALGALVGLHAQPYGFFFRKVIRPRIGPPTAMEAAAPPRFAQLVGLIFLAIALVSVLLGLTALTGVALALALAAAFLNAAFAFCLGCEMYLLGKRLAHR